MALRPAEVTVRSAAVMTSAFSRIRRLGRNAAASRTIHSVVTKTAPLCSVKFTEQRMRSLTRGPAPVNVGVPSDIVYRPTGLEPAAVHQKRGCRETRITSQSSRSMGCQDSAELRIVDQDLWDAAKERQRATKQDPKSGEANKLWEWRRPRCLLSGLTFCGRCAGGYSIISATHVGCSTARNKGTCSNRLTIKRTDLEDRVVGSLKSRLWTRLCSKSFARNLRAR